MLKQSVIYLLAFLLCLCLPLAGNGLCADEAQYEAAPLSELDRREAAAWSNFARAVYLASEPGADVKQLREYLKACLLELPEAKLPMFLLLGSFDESEKEPVLQIVAEILQANPDNRALNLFYVDGLVANQQSEEACAWLYELGTRENWQKPDIAARLLYLHIAAGRLEEAGSLIAKLRRHKTLLQQPLLRLMQAWHLIKANSDLKPKAKRRIEALLESLAQLEELKTDQDLFYKTCAVLYDYKDWERMQRILNQAPEAWKSEPAWLMQKLLVFEQQQDGEGLYEFYQKRYAKQRLHPGVLSILGHSFYKLGSLTYAIEMQELLLRANPQAEGERLHLALLYMQARESKKALALLVPLQNNSMRAMLLMANLYSMEKDYAKALAQFKKIVEAASKSDNLADMGQLNSGFYASYAWNALLSGNVEMALRLYAQAYKLDPESAELCNSYGYTLADENLQLPFAEELIEKALAQEPDNVAYLDSRAWVRYRRQKMPEALQAILHCIEEASRGGFADREIWEHAEKIFQANGLEWLAELYGWKAAQ